MLHRTNPMSAAIDMAKSTLSLWWMGVETVTASWAVIAARTPVIDRAMRDPANADTAELSRMVGEKLDAFSKAAVDVQSLGWTLYTDMWKQMLDLGQPTLSSQGRMVSRSQRMTRNVMTAGHRAIRPVHRAVTANQKRLSGGTRGKAGER